MYSNDLQSRAAVQRATGTPHIHDPSGLRFAIDDRHNVVNERQSAVNGQNLVNGHQNSVNEHSVNGYSNHQIFYNVNNDVAKNQMKIVNTDQSELTNGSTHNKPERLSDRSNYKHNDYRMKNCQNNVNHKNGINRLANGKSPDQEELRKDTYNIAANLRQLLRPTVIEKRQENAKVERDAEDINGPYNFRQLLRPTGYLPTESLRKRKGGIVSNGVPLPKDKVPEKHVKRRAPLAPTQSKLANGKK